VKNSSSVGVDASALLFDFGAAPFRYKAAGKALEAAKFDSLSGTATLIVSARTAYYNYLLTQRLLVVNEDALKQANVHFNQASILFKVGKQAQIEVTKSRVDVANAEVGVIHAKNAVDLARVQMEVVAGALLPDPLTLTDSLTAVEDSVALNEAIAGALKKRPEINSLQADVAAAQLQSKAARASYLPALTAKGSASWGASDGASVAAPDFSNTPNWSIGAGLSVPIYQGGRIGASVKQADAGLMQAQAQLDALKLIVTQQVRQYFLQEKEALQRIAATRTLIEQARESLTLSQERFRAGVAFSIEITDAELTLANARASNAQAHYDYHVAHTNLLQASGDLDFKD
jgi:outer membrane protein TolC